jgi:FMN-dependent dehydrogenase
MVSFAYRFLADSNLKQAIARQVMTEKAWAYYSSAADDEITNRENHAAYHRFEHFIFVVDVELIFS